MLAKVLSQRKMITNSEIKLIRSLKEKKYREEHGLFVVEGEKLVNEALNSTFEVVRVFYREEIGEKAMERISLLNTPSPVLAVVRIPEDGVVLPSERGLYLALDSIRDPGNLGTIIRLADWFGVNDIFASYDTVDVYNPKTIQSTMGAVFRKKVHYCNLESLCRYFIVSAVSYLLKDDDRLSSLVSVVIRPDIAEYIKSREEALLYIDEAVAVQYGISGEQLLDIKKALA